KASTEAHFFHQTGRRGGGASLGYGEKIVTIGLEHGIGQRDRSLPDRRFERGHEKGRVRVLGDAPVDAAIPAGDKLMAPCGAQRNPGDEQHDAKDSPCLRRSRTRGRLRKRRELRKAKEAREGREEERKA